MNFKQLKIFLIISFLFLFPLAIFAQEPCETKYPDDGKCKVDCEAGEFYDDTAGLCTTGKCCHKYAEALDLTLQVPLFKYVKAENIADYLVTIYNLSLFIVVPIVILVIIYAGVMWIFSGVNVDLVKKSKSYIINAFIGLGLILFSYIILSIFNLTEFKGLQIEYIPEEFVNNETGGDACDATKPWCTGSTTFLQIKNRRNYFISQVQAQMPAHTSRVPLIKQWQSPYDKTPYGICGTIKSSGCGITSLTMVMRYLTGQSINLVEIAKKAGDDGYRVCPQNAKWDENKQDCPTCSGTSYDIFKTGSTILKQYNLQGKSLMGKNATTNILNHLKNQEPVIVSVSKVDIGDGGNPETGKPNRFTSFGHFIVLTGCENCDGKDPKGVVIWVNDPNRNNQWMTLAELRTPGFLKSAFLIYK
ncbi:MAG TPA: hypothetical protein ENN28_03625 [Candidatus Uhrbacteria bacterium]|nr:hypothetical protein [Candidatus Uhrbacteria bacterium]